MGTMFLHKMFEIEIVLKSHLAYYKSQSMAGSSIIPRCQKSDSNEKENKR